VVEIVEWQHRTEYPARSTGVPYRGINVLTLWVAAMTKGYASPHWLTFKQALALGGWPLCIIRTQIFR
jgi:antirestriction protein ArdC